MEQPNSDPPPTERPSTGHAVDAASSGSPEAPAQHPTPHPPAEAAASSVSSTPIPPAQHPTAEHTVEAAVTGAGADSVPPAQQPTVEHAGAAAVAGADAVSVAPAQQPTVERPLEVAASGVSVASVPPAQQPTTNETFGQLDGYVEQLRVKLPAAPPGLLDFYMRFFPWIALIFGVLGVVFSLLGMLLGAVFSPFLLLAGASGVAAGGALFLALLVGLITAAIEAVGGYLMLKRQATGWWLLALGLVVSFLTNLVHGSVVGLIVFALIAYVHLQVKPNYH